MASSCADKVFRVWDTKTLKEVKVITVRTGRAGQGARTREGRFLFYINKGVGESGKVRISVVGERLQDKVVIVSRVFRGCGGTGGERGVA